MDSNQEPSSVLQRNFLLRWSFYPVERTLVKRVAVDIFLTISDQGEEFQDRFLHETES